MIDSLQANKFFGNEKTSFTPNIDNLIKNGTYFSQTIGSADATLLSWPGIFTGKFSFKTGIRSLRFHKLDKNISTYFAQLKNDGYHFYADIPTLATKIGLFPEFENDDYHYDSHFYLFDGLGEKIISLLDSKKMKSPWIYYIHLDDLHYPIVVPNDYKSEKYGDSNYEKTVSAIDFWVGKIIEKIDLSKTIIVITADHGTFVKSIRKNGKKINLEVNGELQLKTTSLGNKIPKPLQPLKSKGFFILEKIRKRQKLEKIKRLNLKPHEKRALLSQRSDVEHLIFDDHVHVPLLFAGYNIPKDKVVHQLVRSMDIFPTISDLAILSGIMDNIDGRSLVPFMKDDILNELPAYIESTPLMEIKTNDVIGIRTSKYKYFRDKDNSEKRIFLYDIQNDPHEDNNIASMNPSIVKEMENILQNILKDKPINPSSEVSDDDSSLIEEELKKLGYL
jgi:arylsulfatase A-like enzyme